MRYVVICLGNPEHMVHHAATQRPLVQTEIVRHPRRDQKVQQEDENDAALAMERDQRLLLSAEVRH